jgi:hypothetical protein
MPDMPEQYPVRNPIQIAYNPNSTSGKPTVLCDDGTIWIDENGKWILLDPIPQLPLPSEGTERRGF